MLWYVGVMSSARMATHEGADRFEERSDLSCVPFPAESQLLSVTLNRVFGDRVRNSYMLPLRTIADKEIRHVSI